MILYKIKEPEFVEQENGSVTLDGTRCWWEIRHYPELGEVSSWRTRKYVTATDYVVWTKYKDTHFEAEDLIRQNYLEDILPLLDEVVIK